MKEEFMAYAQVFPEKQAQVTRAQLFLRRAGIDSIQELSTLFREDRERIAKIRGIGPHLMELLEQMLNYFSG